jgi:hypothetical protein
MSIVRDIPGLNGNNILGSIFDKFYYSRTTVPVSYKDSSVDPSIIYQILNVIDSNLNPYVKHKVGNSLYGYLIIELFPIYNSTTKKYIMNPNARFSIDMTEVKNPNLVKMFFSRMHYHRYIVLDGSLRTGSTLDTFMKSTNRQLGIPYITYSSDTPDDKGTYTVQKFNLTTTSSTQPSVSLQIMGLPSNIGQIELFKYVKVFNAVSFGFSNLPMPLQYFSGIESILSSNNFTKLFFKLERDSYEVTYYFPYGPVTYFLPSKGPTWKPVVGNTIVVSKPKPGYRGYRPIQFFENVNDNYEIINSMYTDRQIFLFVLFAAIILALIYKLYKNNCKFKTL